MIEHFIPEGSTYAGEIDHLILLIAALVGFWFLCAQGMFFWLMWRFRARKGHKAEYITGDEKHLKRWVSWPHFLIIICDVIIIWGAINVWVDVKMTLPEPDTTIRVISQQWAWTFVDPGPDGQLDTDDDITTVDEMHVEVDKTYHFQLQSRDVLHSFFVPIFRLKQDAVPGRVITGWFKPTVTGEYGIQCAEICGIGHGIMGARLFVETPEQHATWVSRHSSSVLAASE